MAHTLWSVLLSKSEQIHLLISLSLTEFFCNETSRAWASLGPEASTMGFASQLDATDWLSIAQSPCQVCLSSFKHNFEKRKDDDLCNIFMEERSWTTEEKKQWEKCAEESPS